MFSTCDVKYIQRNDFILSMRCMLFLCCCYKSKVNIMILFTNCCVVLFGLSIMVHYVIGFFSIYNLVFLLGGVSILALFGCYRLWWCLWRLDVKIIDQGGCVTYIFRTLIKLHIPKWIMFIIRGGECGGRTSLILLIPCSL